METDSTEKLWKIQKDILEWSDHEVINDESNWIIRRYFIRFYSQLAVEMGRDWDNVRRRLN
jgi:hypothetical protein